MRSRILRAAVLLGLVTSAAVAFAFSTGPPASRTGAPAVPPLPAEGLCTVCHMGSPVNDPAGKLEILDLPGIYTPGQIYPVRVRLSFAHLPADSVAPYKWGTQVTAVLAANGNGAGTFFVSSPGLQIVVPTQTSTFKTRRYVEHTSEGTHDGEVGPVEWTFQWQAPPADSGAVYFFASGNAANGDGVPAPGDYIFWARDTVFSTTPVAVHPGPLLPYTTEMDPLHPNPFTRFTDVSYSVARGASIDLSVFDIQGRRVRSLYHGWHPGGLDGMTWYGDGDDGKQVPNGVYFVKLRTAGEGQVLIRKVLRTH